MNIGLILSGAMAKGAYQAGALKALSNFVPLDEIKYISAASVGALNGYAFATNKMDTAETLWNSICKDENRLLANQVFKSGVIQNSIHTLFGENDTLPKKFYVPLLDATHQKVVYKNISTVDSESIENYLKASVAMPFYSRSVKIDDISYFDGAVIDNIPVYPLLKHNLDYIICIYFDDSYYTFENTYFDNKIIKITFPGRSILNQYFVFDKHNIERSMIEGEQKATLLLNSIFAKGYEDIDYIYQAIEFENSKNADKKLRITGDVLATGLNKIAQKFTKRKIIF